MIDHLVSRFRRHKGVQLRKHHPYPLHTSGRRSFRKELSSTHLIVLHLVAFDQLRGLYHNKSVFRNGNGKCSFREQCSFPLSKILRITENEGSFCHE
jgi:hypothetical protein